MQARQLQLNPVLSLPDGHNEMIFALAVDTAHQQFVTGGRPVCHQWLGQRFARCC